MKLGRVFADLDQATQRPLLHIRTPCFVGRYAEHIKIIQLAGSLRPERLQRGCRVCITLDEEIAQAEQIARLECIRHIVYDRLEWRNGVSKIVLAIVRQPDIEPYAGNLRGQVFRLLQHLERRLPLFTPHVDHAQVCICARDLWIDRKHAAKRVFSLIQIAVFHRRFTLLKKLLGIGILRRGRVLRLLTLSCLCCLRTASLPGN